ncbi:ABC1 family-domain-containing protein [Phyllosticta citriasiana]|uniref:ABC1 family-domain-containing protein n=1 Tax=Phyllosticta citriasiana TaxID=595635 RepID=UPI0030FDC1D9
MMSGPFSFPLLLRRSPRSSVWTCRPSVQAQQQPFRKPLQPRNNYATQQAEAGIVFAAATVGGLATAVAVSDDAKHAYTAIRRTGRVVGTLFVCINDYRVTLKHDDNDPNYPDLLKACHKRCAERTMDTLEKNGSIFIKLGQHLSSMNYLLPSEWCDTFIPLQDKCPISSFESIEAMVRKDSGKELMDYFSQFESMPIGAASLAQVHLATIKETGQKVAVKVQHPTLDEWAPLDLALTRFTFATLKRFFPEYDLTWLASEMDISLPQELDFRREAENAMRAKRYFANVKDAPLVIPDVLWQSYVTGHRPDDFGIPGSHGIDRDEVSAALARIFNEMIFGTNAPLHCDPHGGNLAIRHNPDIPLTLRRSYAKLWLAADADEPRMRKYAKEVAAFQTSTFPYLPVPTRQDYTQSGKEEKEAISEALGEGMLQQLTNDLTRSLDENLHTRQGPVRHESLGGSMLKLGNIIQFLRAWTSYVRVDVKLTLYEYIWRCDGFECT